MLDQLSHGRLDIGVGKGSSPIEAAMYGLTPADTAARFESLFPAIVEALETGTFRRPGVEGPAGEPVPLHVPVHQRPHPRQAAGPQDCQPEFHPGHARDHHP